MRFGVNVRRLEGQRLGVGRYIENLLTTWSEALRPDESMTLYLRAPLHPEDAWIAQRYETAVVRPRLTGIAWENGPMARAARGIDLFFGPSYTVPLTYRGPCVVATHSVNEVAPGAHPWWYTLMYSTLYRLSAQKSVDVIVPSPSVAANVNSVYGVPAARLHVVRQGAPDSFAPVEDAELIRRTRLEYTGSERPYILFVGKFSERRNIPLLIRAFAKLRTAGRIPHNLLLLGPNHLKLPLKELCAELGVADHVTITNRVFSDHEEIMPVFSASDLYAFPSRFEGASNTTVEAMACGVPVVAGRCDAIADIVEGSGTLVDDVTVDSFAEAMEAALADRARWNQMRLDGLAKAAGLRWSHTAHQTLDIMRAAASR